MASDTRVLRTCGLLIYVLIHVNAFFDNNVEPRILSLKINSKICEENTCKYFLNVSGGEFIGHYSWRMTPSAAARGGSCDVIHPNHEIKEITSGKYITTLQIILPNLSGKIFFCVHYDDEKNIPFGGKWVHQGVDYYLDPKNDVEMPDNANSNTSSPHGKTSNANIEETTPWPDLSRDIAINYLPNVPKVSHTEKRDIEVLVQDKYVPLNDLQRATRPKGRFVFDGQTNYIGRYRRNIVSDKRTKSRQGQENEALNEDEYKIDSYGGSNSNIEEEYKYDTKRVNNLDNNQSSSPLHPSIKHSNTVSPYKNHTTNKIKPKVTKIPSSVIRKRNLETILKEFYKDNNFTSDSYKNEKNKQEKVKVAARAPVLEFNDALNAGPGKVRRPRQLEMSDLTSVHAAQVPLFIEGIRVEDSSKEPNIIEGGIPSVLAETGVTLRVFGDGLTTRTVIAFTHHEQSYGQPCKFLLKGEYMVKEGSLKARTALFDIIAPAPLTEPKLYICAKNLRPGVTDPTKDEEKYMHQGNETFKVIATHNTLLPLWVSLSLILICLTFSALFSGLNLGLMSMDRTELKIISNTGTEQERKYARAIMPVRDHGNYLLCSILLGNVAVNSTFTILLDELTSGLFAVIFSTLSIVLLGEITPQAICSRHGLMIGAKSIMVTKAVMALTAPMAFPVSKLLDYFLGEEIGSVYNRERLKELVKITTDVNDLDKDEVNIISGALELRKKTVSDVMTKLEDVFMLPISSVLDFETMSEIVKSGYSRIPVYEGGRGNIVTVLFIKDLAFVDPDDNTPLRTLCHYYQNPCNFVFEDVTLDVMFKQFKEGNKGHMAFVHRINNEGEGDPFYETIGLVTLEDVIEEMIQAEIVDETDVFMDNRSKRRRNRPQNKLQDFAAFAERHENQRIHISPQLTLATFQFLSTSVDAFRPDTVSETVLRRLLRQDVIHHVKLKGRATTDPATYVFQQGKPVDYFVLILEGRVEVTVGRENLVFEAGPFTYFGVQALTQNIGVAESPTPSAMGSLQNINMDSMLRHTFVPDYSVRAVTELFYLTVKRTLYLAAKRATLMEKGALSKGPINEQFDNEVDKNLCDSSTANIPISLISRKLLGKSHTNTTADIDSNDTLHDKLLQSVDEDISISGEHKTPSRQVSPHPHPLQLPPPPPTSACPLTRASFASPERNGDVYTARADEQEKLLK